MTISASEGEVMRVIWAKKDIKSSEIIEILQKKFAWSDSTIKTLILRLVEKQAISSHRQGRAFLYTAEINQDQFQEEEIDNVFSKICVTNHSKYIAKLISETPMTKSNIEQLKQLLDKKEAVDTVVCHCLPGQCQCHHHLQA